MKITPQQRAKLNLLGAVGVRSPEGDVSLVAATHVVVYAPQLLGAVEPYLLQVQAGGYHDKNYTNFHRIAAFNSVDMAIAALVEYIKKLSDQ